eukprot:CAMPEP_0114361890 /NCGR_PEP_ID=MMETSP0101-20121206/25166_1 /TAXON_ID=38822 ORGANISM="Pteridomonas danica, Strain PT" /NCGR_SAMPLE_ID=MMETSP0101 /ASSEMBLY_ACC=CAM_ASM_000211 /LENGTH=173 /DNA_ID=CAMNT_0001507279 /DNA_START=38 /DNA_END=559 /DNA_ORIENTATION=-
MASFLEPHVIEDGAGVFQHAGTTAHHEPVIFQIKFRQVQVLRQLAVFHRVGQPPGVTEILTGDRGIVKQLAINHFAEEFVIRQLLNIGLVRQLGLVANAMGHDDFIIGLIDFRVLDDADKRCQAGACADQPKILTRQQVVHNQGTGGLATDHDLIAYLNFLFGDVTSAGRPEP